jgi:hypothetical protein
MDSSGSEYDPVTSYCVHGNEPLCSMHGGEFHDQLSDCQLLKALLQIVNYFFSTSTTTTSIIGIAMIRVRKIRSPSRLR